ncbi:MAG: peptide transporter substrate-binding protein, partial [Caulobacteraceae bacterium]|nr:peptide transporter substrate-binding protein [Caulobacteraceae bacterium]
MIFRGLLLLPALAIALALGACTPRAAVQTCDPGHKCLHIGNSAEPLSMDPNIITSVQDDNIVSDMVMGLTQTAQDGTVIPGMAESWSTSADGLVWTFKLRDAKWSDGTSVTAGDFVYGMRRLQNPDTAAEYAYLAYILKGAQEINTGKAPLDSLGARAIDDKTLELTLTHPAPYLLELTAHMTFYPLPQHVVEKWGEHWTDPEHMVANGPFKLAYWKLGDRVKLVKNPLFYEANQVCADEVYYYATNDAVA